MTQYEFFRWVSFPVMPTLLVTVRKDIARLISGNSRSVLDVGGRKSPYTIGLDADITIMDIPRETDNQEKLNLGFTDEILSKVQRTRSNIKQVLIEDMTRTTIPENTYDAVVCVEVIEHVEEDDIFVRNISKVLNDHGWAYFTTPNGDYIKNEPPNFNPDHKRHYTKAQLQALLEKYFGRVEVKYAVKTGKYRRMGQKSYSIKKPLRTFKSIVGNLINRSESKGLSQSSTGTAHLIATAFKH